MVNMEQHIQVTRTARYVTYGKLHDGTQQVWIACHGYGMLAAYFIKKFEALDPEKHFVIAPEALSRAYLDGMSGRVGASWMTKEDRETEIADYISYLDNLYVHELEGKLSDGCKVIGLGFSQGCATISRWACATKHRVDGITLWGGSPGSELLHPQSALHRYQVHFVLGNKDEYFTEEVRQQFREGMQMAGFDWQLHTYDGGHALEESMISELSEVWE
jgi:predicted esterase